ncbi:unnamed protein product [Sphagnum troendelagicum]|uniref:Protein kinase domain-containing protein n=1 Tax=Sphagnum troendelagicum TaxID=128251 RepID=A0ABP0UD08_9BRYO
MDFSSAVANEDGFKRRATSTTASGRGGGGGGGGDLSSLRVKLLCSFDGKILPRPGDGRLRYVGGETRIITVNHDISYAELVFKVTEICGNALTLKYQLPDEDLDALVSVSSDEDLENMMEEYDKLRGFDGFSRLRVFLFPAVEYDVTHLSDDSVGDQRNPDQRYVDAVNGVPKTGSRKHSETGGVGVPSIHSDNLIGLDVVDPWSATSVSTGLLVPQISQDVASLIHAPVSSLPLSVSSFHTNAEVPSAASFALSSPPLIPRVSKQSAIPNLHFQFYPEANSKVDSSSHHIPFMSQSMATPTLPPPIGSDPSSPRFSFRESGRHPGGRQQQQQQHQQQSQEAGYHHHHHPVEYQQPQEEVFSMPFMNRSVAKHILPSSPIGSSPSSPRYSFLESGRHAAGGAQQQQQQQQQQSQQVHRGGGSNGLSDYVDQQYAAAGVLHHPTTTDPPPSRSFHPSASAHFGDRLVHSEERLTRPTLLQQPAHVSSDWLLPHEQRMYEPSPLSQTRFSDPVTRSQIPHYTGSNPFQDDLADYEEEYYDTVQAGQHPFQAEDIQASNGAQQLQQQQQHFHPQHSNSKTNYQNALDYLEEDTSAADIRVTHAMEASRSGGGCYPHLPEDADALLATSPAEPFQQMKVDWADPLGNSNLHLRPPSVPQSNVMSGYSPALGRVATFRDGSSKASSPYVGGQGSNDPDFLALLPPPRCGDSSTIQDLRSTSSFLDVCGSHLPPLIPSAQMQSASSGGPLVEDRGEPSRPRIGNNTIDSTEEEPRNGVQVSSDEMQRKAGRGISDDEDGMHALYGLRDLGLDDRPLQKVQLPLSTMELHATPLPPPTGKMISNVIPTASIQEFATANTLTSHMPLSYSYPNKRLLPEHTPSSCATAAINVGVVMPKTISLGSENIESFERKPGFHKKYDNVSSLDLSASGGNLALDMASAVFSKQSATPLERRKNDLSEDGKGTWLHDFQAPFISSPIFGLQSWEENLANLEKEFDGVSLKQQSLNDEDHVPEEAIFEKIEVKDQHFDQNQARLDLSKEVRKLESYFGNSASDAEAEAISRGLQTIKNDDLEELRELGSGTYGTVYHGKWRGTDVAIKRIRASCFAGQPSEKERLIADFWKEACTLSQLHHPNVVAFYGVVRDGPGGTLATVTEYMVNGSLKQVLQKNDRTIDRHKRLLLATDAAFGMEYLHEKNIVHFDLKCENLLVNMRDPQRPICKVGDLGLSKVKQQTMVSGGIRGTLPWMAPELLNSTSNMVTEKVDVFSFGIVMWELLTGEEPYANLHYGAIIGGIVNNTLRPKVPTWCDPSWKLLMERCWASDPVDRPGFTDIASNLRAMTAATHPKAQGQFHVTLLP